MTSDEPGSRANRNDGGLAQTLAELDAELETRDRDQRLANLLVSFLTVPDGARKDPVLSNMTQRLAHEIEALRPGALRDMLAGIRTLKAARAASRSACATH